MADRGVHTHQHIQVLQRRGRVAKVMQICRQIHHLGLQLGWQLCQISAARTDLEGIEGGAFECQHGRQSVKCQRAVGIVLVGRIARPHQAHAQTWGGKARRPCGAACRLHTQVGQGGGDALGQAQQMWHAQQRANPVVGRRAGALVYQLHIGGQYHQRRQRLLN